MKYEMECSIKPSKLKKYDEFVIGADIGATNSNIEVFGVKEDKIEKIFSYVFASSTIDGLIEPLNKVLDYAKKEYKMSIHKCCLAVAGVIVNNVCKKMTNQPWGVIPQEIIKKTPLKKIKLLNDFEAIGYGIEQLSEKDFILLKKGKNIKNATKAIIGAGSGLGESILKFEKDSYVAMPSEGGHSDFSSQNKEEFNLVQFLGPPVEYEEILSGPGLMNLYNFYKKYSKIKINKPPMITENANKDEACKKAMQLFTRIYARAAKNLALTTLPLGGLYIAGGIAPKIIIHLQKSNFEKEFTNVKSKDIKSLLKSIPIYVIMKYDVSVYGAANIARKL